MTFYRPSHGLRVTEGPLFESTSETTYSFPSALSLPHPQANDMCSLDWLLFRATDDKVNAVSSGKRVLQTKITWTKEQCSNLTSDDVSKITLSYFRNILLA